MIAIGKGIESVVAAISEHEQFVSSLRTLGADVEAWVQWVNDRAEEGGTHQVARASALANIVTGRMHPDDPPPQVRGISAGYTYADEREDWADAREAWLWAWMVERAGGAHGLLSVLDIINLRLASACLTDREQPDPLTLPLRRGHPRTRCHDHG